MLTLLSTPAYSQNIQISAYPAVKFGAKNSLRKQFRHYEHAGRKIVENLENGRIPAEDSFTRIPPEALPNVCPGEKEMPVLSCSIQAVARNSSKYLPHSEKQAIERLKAVYAYQMTPSSQSKDSKVLLEMEGAANMTVFMPLLELGTADALEKERTLNIIKAIIQSQSAPHQKNAAMGLRKFINSDLVSEFITETSSLSPEEAKPQIDVVNNNLKELTHRIEEGLPKSVITTALNTVAALPGLMMSLPASSISTLSAVLPARPKLPSLPAFSSFYSRAEEKSVEEGLPDVLPQPATVASSSGAKLKPTSTKRKRSKKNSSEVTRTISRQNAPKPSSKGKAVLRPDSPDSVSSSSSQESLLYRGSGNAFALLLEPKPSVQSAEKQSSPLPASPVMPLLDRSTSPSIAASSRKPSFSDSLNDDPPAIASSSRKPSISASLSDDPFYLLPPSSRASVASHQSILMDKTDELSPPRSPSPFNPVIEPTVHRSPSPSVQSLSESEDIAPNATTVVSSSTYVPEFLPQSSFHGRGSRVPNLSSESSLPRNLTLSRSGWGRLSHDDRRKLQQLYNCVDPVEIQRKIIENKRLERIETDRVLAELKAPLSERSASPLYQQDLSPVSSNTSQVVDNQLQNKQLARSLDDLLSSEDTNSNSLPLKRLEKRSSFENPHSFTRQIRRSGGTGSA